MTRKKFGKVGYFRLMRWSNADGTNNCHLMIDPITMTSTGQSSTVFQLSNYSGFPEIQALFDNYRITTVKYRWITIRNPDFVTTGSAGLFPRLTWVHDFNDSVSISRSQMMQHAAMKEHFFSDTRQATRWFTLKPASLTLKYETGTSTAYNPQWGSWVDTSDQSMAHYGLKFAWSDLLAGQQLRLEAKIYMELKGIS